MSETSMIIRNHHLRRDQDQALGVLAKKTGRNKAQLVRYFLDVCFDVMRRQDPELAPELPEPLGREELLEPEHIRLLDVEQAALKI